MRSARMILATAAVTAALAVGAPGAHAADGGWDHDTSSHSKEDGHSTGKTDGWSGKHDKEEHADHDAPHGGMHTGGGALTALTQGGDHDAAQDPRFDPETYKDKDWQKDQDRGHDGERGQDASGQDDTTWKGGHEEDGGWKGEHDKPSGGMHTGGGALAGPSLTAGGLGILALTGTALYALRRKKT
ncbi:hypothetical protein, partial [Streptomyces hilarionis]|uniref:hypothetical protein n=1 Tax=Streptomyces hilarionis TaxID=2839954 RepID=UPI00211A3FCA